MFQGFKKVLIIEPRKDAAQFLKDICKELGATETVIYESVKDGWSYLQTAESIPDWIITIPDMTERFHVYHLMMLLITKPDFAKTRISMLVSDDELGALPVAFDLGLLSYHKKPFTKITLHAELEALLKNLPVDYDLHYEVAADYLRTHLNEKDQFERRIAFDKSLINRFPKATKHYISLAEGQVLAEKMDDARKTLSIAKHLGATFTLGVKQLADMVGAGSGPEASISDFFGIKSALIVEPDSAATMAIRQALTQLGVSKVDDVSDGEAAIEWLKKNGKPSILLIEWKIPKISGPALVQRVRQMGMIDLPIVVASSLLKDKDRHLLKEIGVSANVTKPVHVEFFVSDLVNVFQNELVPTNASKLERQIRQQFEQGQQKAALDFYAQYKKLTGVPKGLNLLVEATVFYYTGKYAEARDAAFEALKEKGEAVIVLGLLSKVYLKLNDKDSAIKCLNRAQEFSSDNLQRLIMMAEEMSEAGNADQARDALEKAKQVDGTNPMVKQAEAEVSMMLGDTKKAKSVIGQMDSAKSLIANMNNRAVLLVNGNEVDKGLSLYQKAIEGLPETMKVERDTIAYNLGLAYARNNRLKEAATTLNEIVTKNATPAIVEKAQALAGRVESAIKTNQKIKLNVNTEVKLEIKVAPPVKPVALHLQPGQMCLHGIFDASDLYVESVKKVIASTPTFNRKKHETLSKQKAS